MYPGGTGTVFSPTVALGTFLDLTLATENLHLIPLGITLAGGVFGLISFGKRKPAAIAAVIVLAGTVLYMVFLLMDILPSGVLGDVVSTEGYSPLLGSYLEDLIVLEINHTWGVSVGCYGALFFGLLVLVGAIRARD